MTDFERLRQEILEGLEALTIDIPEELTLIDGFFRQQYSQDLETYFLYGGSVVPTIMLVGNETGRVYFFALKAILSEETINRLDI